jgi:tripartite tricarboxylate transporter family receptor
VLPHLIGEWFKSAAAIDIVHVPYRGGGPSIHDLVAGQVQMTFEGTSVLLPLSFLAAVEFEGDFPRPAWARRPSKK